MKLAASYIALGLLFCVEAQPANSRSGDDNYVLPPLAHTFFCMQYPSDCARTDSTAALPISLDGRWRKMNLVNTAVNAAIAVKSNPDRVRTHWLLAPQEGNCNDYSVMKRHELLKADWPSSSLLLAEVTLISTGEHHLILIVRGAQASWVLDNLKDGIVTLAATDGDYVLNRIESSDNPQFWTDSSRSAQMPHRVARSLSAGRPSTQELASSSGNGCSTFFHERGKLETRREA